ncbi:GFA family protein [Clostridium sp.]|uniref:GFA family protein n=1 Tax=Clostridium sp. TaxID=1506 RepID=UPI00258D6A0A|nr:GFA family protein [Clostridium sp.]MDF2503046.1 glutathione-dependent formaldehyde-activating [Clostridium sp.]
MKYKGSCLCGEVTFEIEGDFENFFLCHCERCRYHSEGHIKSFCSNCGSALPNIQFDGRLLVVPAGCIDSDIHMKPQGHIFCANKASWDNDLENVPNFEELPNR